MRQSLNTVTLPGDRFFRAKPRHAIHRPFVARGELPPRPLRSQGSQAAPGARTSTRTRVLGTKSVLLPSRFLCQERLTASRPKYARVHLLLSVQIMSVYGKEVSHALLYAHTRFT